MGFSALAHFHILSSPFAISKDLAFLPCLLSLSHSSVPHFLPLRSVFLHPERLRAVRCAGESGK